MVALMPGITAPEVTLRNLQGSSLSLSSALSNHKFVVLAFFKVGCPVCQFIFPYLERLHQRHPKAAIWGISQDDAKATEAFLKTYGATFPVLLDENLDHTVNYGLTNVPTVFIVDKSGQVKLTSVGFVKDDLEEVNLQLSQIYGTPHSPLFTDDDNVPAVRPG